MVTLLQQGTDYEVYVRDIIKDKYDDRIYLKDLDGTIL